jgi:L-alanine-DL-glutamate epimerase-like enolase superfamily enzyme
VDGAWIFREAGAAASFLDSVAEAHLAWFEDGFPPGDAALVAELRSKTETPIAMGDEQGGSYYPEALLLRNAVDVVRIDMTCMGGLSCVRDLIDRCKRAGVAVSPHMNAHVHSRTFAALGKEVPIEWGVQWSGVDQFADALEQPKIIDGFMEPLRDEPGFGTLVNAPWLCDQEVDDPDDLLSSLDATNSR